MSRLQFGIVRYASIGTAIARALGAGPVPDYREIQGRQTLTFRQLGATRWPEAQQAEHAHRIAALARDVLAADKRREIRQRTSRAIVIVYEDVGLVRGCAVTARWECVIPGTA